MESRPDSKYYIYVNDEQLGPFSDQMILEELQHERLGQDVFLWKSGMPGWQKVEEIESFAAFAQYLPETSKITQNLRLNTWSNDLSFLPSVEAREDFTNYPLGRTTYGEQSADLENAPASSPVATVMPEPTRFSPKTLKWAAGALALSALFVAGIFYYQDQTKYRSVLAGLDGAPHEIDKMENALRGNIVMGSPVLALREIGDVREPSLFIGGRIPDGSRLQVTVTGIGNSLLGALNQTAKFEVVMQEGMARIPTLKKSNDYPLAPGFYTVSVDCTTCPPGKFRQLKAASKIAVGIADQAAYVRDLEAFHKLLHKQAESELAEVSEIINLLDERANSPKLAQSGPQTQLREVLMSINQDAARSSYVYGALYIQLQRTLHLIDQKTDMSSIQSNLTALRTQVARNLEALSTNQGYPVVLE